PTRSLQLALNGSVPSPLDVLLLVQLAGSRPLPPALSLQFQLTVTSLLFQPAPLAVGDWLGAATGAVTSTRNLTLLSVLVEARLRLPKASVMNPAAIAAVSVP